MPLILASSSPRRAELLARITSEFIILPSRIRETASGPPQEQVMTLARNKARAVGERQQGIIIGADTIVEIEGEILGKPHSRDQARRMIQRLSGQEHRVLTGLFLLSTERDECRQACEITTVFFRHLSKSEIETYLACGEYEDKAGAYAIQGRAALFVERICGDFYNVVGLPLCRLVLLLRDLGLDLPAPHLYHKIDPSRKEINR